MQDAEIRHLAALIAVADEPSLRIAARRLGWAQSTLQRQLRELEQAAGRPLIELGRGARGSPGLTSAGRMMREHAEAVIARVGAARADLDALRRGESLRVGVCDGVATQVVQAVLHAQPAPSIVPSIGGSAAELVERVEQGEVDLSLLALPMPAGPIDFVKLVEEPSVALAWHRYRRLRPSAQRFRQAAVDACAELQRDLA